MSTLRLLALTGSALFISLVTAGGCGGTEEVTFSIDDICKRVCDCEKCDATALAKCNSDLEGLAADSATAGCKAESDALFTCFDAKLTCKGDNSDVTACEPESDTLGECVVASKPKTRCEDSTDHLAECTGQMNDPETNCTGASLCAAECVNAASCEALMTAFGPAPATNDPVLGCITDCNEG